MANVIGLRKVEKSDEQEMSEEEEEAIIDTRVLLEGAVHACQRLLARINP